MQKWYNELLFTEGKSKTHDGLSSLLEMFASEEDFFKHFIENTVFFKAEHVNKQDIEYFKSNLDEKKPLMARFSTKSNEHFYFKAENGRGFSVKKFKKRSDAHSFSRKNELFYKNSDDKEILVHIDKDGNYEVRNQIAKYTGVRVSQGTLISNYTNYTISHIWAKTYHPLFFTALWNITLVPTYLAFILDKPDENSHIARKLKLIMKALCYEFYKPEIITDIEKAELKVAFEFAKKCHTENYKFTFI